MCRREIDDLKAEKEILRCQNTEEKSYQVIWGALFTREASPYNIILKILKIKKQMNFSYPYNLKSALALIVFFSFINCVYVFYRYKASELKRLSVCQSVC